MRFWAINPLLDNAWWRPSCTNLKLYPRTLLRDPHSNQEPRLHQGGGPTEEANCEDLERVIIDTDPEKFFQVGAQLPTHEKQALIEFLRNNVDIFA